MCFPCFILAAQEPLGLLNESAFVSNYRMRLSTPAKALSTFPKAKSPIPPLQKKKKRLNQTNANADPSMG